MPVSGWAATCVMLLIASVVDAMAGDPPWLYRRIPHPVTVIGRIGAALETRLRMGALDARQLRLRGLALTVIVVGGSFAIGLLASRLLRTVPLGLVLESVLASTLLALRGLHDHVRAVADGLDRGLDDGRAAVSHIVGRDPDSLDRPGVARAAIESAAENLSDGFVAPLFWGLLLGLPGMLAYKAINTLDSMIGYKDARHVDFGRAAARLDDVANAVPARLCGLLVVVAGLVLPGGDARAALAAMLRDAGLHRSPNAGWPEAAIAGSLGIRLAGPRRYGGEVVADAWMGDGRSDVDADDIRRALDHLIAVGALVAVVLLLGSRIG